jgi:hypothetical protein
MTALDKFCIDLHGLDLTQAQQALALLWYFDKDAPEIAMSAGELARHMVNRGLSSPHSTRLGEAIYKTGHVLKTGEKFRLKLTSRKAVEETVRSILEPEAPCVDQEAGYLPKAIWSNTNRTYISTIAEQINGCYQYGFYDGAAVLIRRLTETLLIECYEHLKIESEIKRDGNYVMLGDIVTNAVDKGKLHLSREAKPALKEIKSIGDRSAHGRRYTAVKAVIDDLRPAARLVIQELLLLSCLK